jgi:hypothetical protein
MGKIKLTIQVYNNRWDTLAKEAVIIPVEKKELPLKIGLAARKLMRKMILEAKDGRNKQGNNSEGESEETGTGDAHHQVSGRVDRGIEDEQQ